ncbi:MAG: amidohydrolase family protein [Planctomycetota bacterium]
MLIDSHHHLWRYSPEQYGWIDDSMSVLKQDFWSQQLREVAAESGVAGFVAVQARQSLHETDTLLSLATQEPLIHGVVGWLPLADTEIELLVDRYGDDPALKGVRHVVQDEDAETFLRGDAFNRGIDAIGQTDWVYDVLVFGSQLAATIEFVDRHPSQPMVLDHIAKPTIRADQFDSQWEADFRELAKRPNLSCKFSGVVTEVRDPEWSVATIQRYWDVAIDAYGADRLMFGSDWPVCLLKTSHRHWTDTVRKLAESLTADEQQRLFCQNARRVYHLRDCGTY